MLLNPTCGLYKLFSWAQTTHIWTEGHFMEQRRRRLGIWTTNNANVMVGKNWIKYTGMIVLNEMLTAITTSCFGSPIDLYLLPLIIILSGNHIMDSSI